jgi:hypothetical protein
MSEPTPKKKGFFSKLESRQDALRLVKDTSNAFFFIAALQAALAYWIGLSVLLDAAMYAVAAFFLRRFNNRTAAVILLILALLGAGVTLANRAGANLGGGNNIILAVIMLWAAVRAVEATFKLRSMFAQDPTSEQPGA